MGVFAPTNEGFAALPAGTVENLLKPANKAQLVDILTYHVLPEAVLSTDLDSFQAVKTVEGKLLHVQKWGGQVRVGPSLQSKDLKTVTAADNKASNGVVHIIDGVLLPPAKLSSSKPNIVELAESVKDFSTLVSAVVAGDLVDTLVSAGPFTVFAPTNEGFGALPAGVVDSLMKPENKANLVDVLTYHVLPVEVKSTQLASFQSVTTVEGKNVKVYKDSKGVRVSPDGKDFKTVTAADNLASNGVVHIIDGVLLPSLVPKGPNIVELAESVKDLSTLVAAVVAGDLVDTLISPGPFTVFAPTNEGFAALPAGTVDSLMKPENKATLVDILTYHVLPSQVLSTDLGLFQAVTTVEGKPLHVQKWGGQVQVGPSLASKDLKKVTAADNMATNGVVHIIDGVLLPPSGKLLSSTPVPEGKAIIETRSTGGLIQCYSGPESKINSQFTIDQDTCYRPGYSQIATFEKDQIVHCSPEGYENYIQIDTFTSGNGQCSGKKKSALVDKDFCFGGPGDAVFIRCPEVTPATTAAPTALNIVELAQSVADLSTLVAAVVA